MLAALFFPRSQTHTGLTGALHQSDQCRSIWGFPGETALRCLDCPEIAAVQVWCSLGFWRSSSHHLGFLSQTGLTGQGHRSDRCRASVEILWFSTGGVLLALRVLLVQVWLWRYLFALGFVVNPLPRIWSDLLLFSPQPGISI